MPQKTVKIAHRKDPKYVFKTPKHPPSVPAQDPEDTPDERVPPRAAPAERVSVPDSPVSFPADAGTWGIEDAGGARLGCGNARGVEVYEWPMADFSIATIRSRWGDGRYKVLFKSTTGLPRGRKGFAIGPEAAPASAPMAAVTPDDPMERGLRFVGALEAMVSAKADAAINRDRTFLVSMQENAAAMFAAAMGRETAAARRPPPVNPEMQELLQRIVAGQEAMARRLDDLEGDEDDPDDPEALNPDPSYPDEWTSLGDMLYRVVARNAPRLEKFLPDIIEGVVDQLKSKAAAQAPPGVSSINPSNPEVSS